MKKTYKGLTLVEVLVSIAVFTIISLAMFSSLLAMTKVVALQEDYARIEMACYDMNAYWDMYGKDWDDYYFDRDPSHTSTEDRIGYLTYQSGKLVPTNDHNNSDFTVKYSEADGKLIILSVRSESKDREYLIDPIECGPSKKGGT